MKEKRRTPRVPLATKVRLETNRGTFNTQGRDLSDGGIGVYLAKQLPLGSPVTVRFVLPGSKVNVEATGEIKYLERGQPGNQDDWLGIRFLRMDPSSQTAIHSYVKANYDSSKPYLPGPPPLPKKS